MAATPAPPPVDITEWSPDPRGGEGIFLSFHYPQEVAGVPVRQFLRQALSQRKGIDLSVLEIRLDIMEWMERLDIDALKVVSEGISAVRAERNELGVLLITHYQKLLDYITPDVVHILVDGRIVDSGGPDLSERPEKEGFDAWLATA